VPMDDEHTICIMFSYHPSEPLPPRMRQVFEEGHAGRESAHPSRRAFAPRDATVPYADYWTRFTRENGFLFDYQSQVDNWFSGLPGLWVQDGACQSATRPIFDRSKEHLSSSDTGIAMTRRLLLEAAGAYRDRGIRPNGVDNPDAFMVRAVSLTLPDATSWIDFGRPHMSARLGAGFGYPL
jgi:phthalate 4,5-dioxygenase